MERILKTMQNHIETLRENQKLVLVAIDGRCGSGKSTLAAALAERMPVNVFHMDDFYLRPEQRTEERFREPGGNVDYERFEQEVMMPLQKGTAFSYRPFDCRTFTLAEPIEVVPSVINIIEGSYSCRPTLYSFYDLRILSDGGSGGAASENPETEWRRKGADVSKTLDSVGRTVFYTDSREGTLRYGI